MVAFCSQVNISSSCPMLHAAAHKLHDVAGVCSLRCASEQRNGVTITLRSLVLGRQSQSNAPARHGNINLKDDCCDTTARQQCRLLLTVRLQSESSMRLSALGHSAATRLSAPHTASDPRRLKTARPGLKHVPLAGSRHASQPCVAAFRRRDRNSKSCRPRVATMRGRRSPTASPLGGSAATWMPAGRSPRAQCFGAHIPAPGGSLLRVSIMLIDQQELHRACIHHAHRCCAGKSTAAE